VAARDVTLLGARNLDLPEQDFIAGAGVHQELGDLPGSVYVAVDGDVVQPGELDVFTPEPGGMRLAALEELLARLPSPAGAGFAGFTCSPRNEAAVARLGLALGL
jgi:arginase family enzyme